MSYKLYELISGRIESRTGFFRRARIIDPITIRPTPHLPHPPFTIPANYIFDVKSFGKMTDTNKSVLSFAIHDWLYENADRNIWKRRDADLLCRKYNPEETEILDKWYAQVILWIAWKLHIGGFHSVFYVTEMERKQKR